MHNKTLDLDKRLLKKSEIESQVIDYLNNVKKDSSLVYRLLVLKEGDVDIKSLLSLLKDESCIFYINQNIGLDVDSELVTNINISDNFPISFVLISNKGHYLSERSNVIKAFSDSNEIVSKTQNIINIIAKIYAT